LFEQFLRRIFNGNDALIRYVQMCIGYSVTGDVGEKALFFFYGTGDNGKTTLLETIRRMLGDYAGQVPIDTLMLKPQGGIPNDIALLKGLRFLTSSERKVSGWPKPD
jgi:putative DNA primase/helicase